jgi:hypothetical protein
MKSGQGVLGELLLLPSENIGQEYVELSFWTAGVYSVAFPDTVKIFQSFVISEACLALLEVARENRIPFTSLEHFGDYGDERIRMMQTRHSKWSTLTQRAAPVQMTI